MWCAVDACEGFAKVSALPDAVCRDTKVGEGRDIHRVVNWVDRDAGGVIRARPKAATLPVFAAVLRLEETSRNGTAVDTRGLPGIECHCAGGACDEAVDAPVLPGNAAVVGYEKASVVGSEEDV